MPNTGCQSCLASIKVIRRLGLCESDLIPVTMQMHAVNNNGIKILGAVILRFSGRSPPSETPITKNFPMVGETLHKCSQTQPAMQRTNPVHLSTSWNTTTKAHWNPIPSNWKRTKLQQWLLDYYRTRTFNTCEHQPLPWIESVPMRLMVDPSADPVAHHTPILVPLHWREDVKAGLEQDVSLGVLEPVPVGEPVTGCHRMVVCAK